MQPAEKPRPGDVVRSRFGSYKLSPDDLRNAILGAGLPASQMAVALYLMYEESPRFEGSRVGVGELSKALSQSPRTIKRALAALEELKLLKSKGDKRREGALRNLNLDPAAWPGGGLEAAKKRLATTSDADVTSDRDVTSDANDTSGQADTSTSVTDDTTTSDTGDTSSFETQKDPEEGEVAFGRGAEAARGEATEEQALSPPPRKWERDRMQRAIATADEYTVGGREFDPAAHERLAEANFCRPGGKGRPYDWPPALYRELMEARLEEARKSEEEAARLEAWREEAIQAEERRRERHAEESRRKEAERLVRERRLAEDREAREAYRLWVESQVEGWMEANPQEAERRLLKHPQWLRKPVGEMEAPAVLAVKDDIAAELGLPAFEDWLQERARPKQARKSA